MLDNTTNDYPTTTLSLDRDNGKTLNLYFEPIYNRINKAVRSFALYRSNKDGDNIFNHLSIPGEIGDNIPGLDRVNGRDYLGNFILTEEEDIENGWKYTGKLLSKREQQRVAIYIRNMAHRLKALLSHQ